MSWGGGGAEWLVLTWEALVAPTSSPFSFLFANGVFNSDKDVLSLMG